MLNHLDNSKTWYLQYLTLLSLKKSNLIERSGQKSGGRKWKYCFWENVLVLVPKHVKNVSCGVSIKLLWNSGAIYEGMKVLLPWMQVSPKSLIIVARNLNLKCSIRVSMVKWEIWQGLIPSKEFHYLEVNKFGPNKFGLNNNAAKFGLTDQQTKGLMRGRI